MSLKPYCTVYIPGEMHFAPERIEYDAVGGRRGRGVSGRPGPPGRGRGRPPLLSQPQALGRHQARRIYLAASATIRTVQRNGVDVF